MIRKFVDSVAAAALGPGADTDNGDTGILMRKSVAVTDPVVEPAAPPASLAEEEALRDRCLYGESFGAQDLRRLEIDWTTEGLDEAQRSFVTIHD